MHVWTEIRRKLLVEKMLEGPNRELTSEFLRLESHLLFTRRFCRVASGNEKGHVEPLVAIAGATFSCRCRASLSSITTHSWMTRDCAAPATVIALLVRDFVLSRELLYALASGPPYQPSLLDLDAGDLAALNDARPRRTLDRLFDAYRASLLSELAVSMIREFHLDVSRLHNDSTTVTFHGYCEYASGRERGGQPTPAITHGFNKNHRPDLLGNCSTSLVSANGAVPIACRCADGRTSDDTSHVQIGDSLRALVGSSSFTYVADSKLCTSEATNHIHHEVGLFITVMPRTRHTSSRWRCLGDLDEVWRTFVSPLPSNEGYRIIWVHSTGEGGP